jgi:uncharacterized metal-binding protein
MREEAFFESVKQEYLTEENRRFYQVSSAVEALGYCRWPRLREIAEFAARMGYRRLGLAFCIGLSDEAEVVSRILREQGFEVVSVVCKTGGIPKTEVGVSEACLTTVGGERVEPTAFQCELLRETMCNPIAQAELLNRSGTEFNICLGLCVGHDSFFYRYSHAPVTTLAVKDRVTGHNPIAAIYCADTYFDGRNKITDD